MTLSSLFVSSVLYFPSLFLGANNSLAAIATFRSGSGTDWINNLQRFSSQKHGHPPRTSWATTPIHTQTSLATRCAPNVSSLGSMNRRRQGWTVGPPHVRGRMNALQDYLPQACVPRRRFLECLMRLKPRGLSLLVRRVLLALVRTTGPIEQKVDQRCARIGMTGLTG
jgi:hypothetical protein